MSLGEVRRGVADRQLRRDSSHGKPVALEASAEDLETRGFISTTTIRPSAGLIANCTLAPPVLTPTALRIANAASRIFIPDRKAS